MTRERRSSDRHRSPQEGGEGTGKEHRGPVLGLSVLFLAVAGVPVGGAGAHQPAADVRARMEQAIALLAAEQFDRAIPILLSVVDDVPFHGPARFQLGALAVERGEWAVAADHLDAAVDSYGPEAPAGAIAVQRPGLAWALYSEALGQIGRLEDALEATGPALRLAPTYLPALLGRSNFARRLAASDSAGPMTESREAFLETSLDAASRAKEAAPDRPAPWTALALAADEARIPQLAQCAARAAADVAPDDPRALFLVAWTAVESAPGEALAAAEQALAAGLRDDPGLWMRLGRLRAFRLDMEGSLAAYREALRLDPASAGEMASVALDAIVADGDPELLTLLESRAARRPEALNTRFALAKAALREGQVERAVRELTALAEAAPEHAAVLTSLHAALRRMGDTAAAEAVLVRLTAVQDAEADAWERANRVEQDRGRARMPRFAAIGMKRSGIGRRCWGPVTTRIPSGSPPIWPSTDSRSPGRAAMPRRWPRSTARWRSARSTPKPSPPRREWPAPSGRRNGRPVRRPRRPHGSRLPVITGPHRGTAP